jgi:hypothetical protein
LALLQQEGRFVDFLEENVTAYSDAEIGGAARVVHEGCRKVIRDYLQIEPVRSRSRRGAADPARRFRCGGGALDRQRGRPAAVHRHLDASRLAGPPMTLPKLAEGHDVRVLAPAEVEL